jgi:hypothetical protein
MVVMSKIHVSPATNMKFKRATLRELLGKSNGLKPAIYDKAGGRIVVLDDSSTGTIVMDDTSSIIKTTY